MDRDAVRKRIAEVGIVPVVRARNAEDARRVVDALVAGGIPVAEVTLTVPGAVEIIRDLCQRHDPRNLLVGAGTVLDAAQAKACLDAGAQFIVSPGLDVETVRYVTGRKVLMVAGALTPTEIIQAWRAGADIVKVFPCGSVGGAKYLKAVKGPLPQVALIPTGGVTLQTVAEFLAAGAEALGVGGELVDAAAVATGRLDVVTANARAFVDAVRAARR